MKKLAALILALVCLAGCAPAEPVPDLSADGGFGLWFAVDEDGEGQNHSDVVEFESRPWEQLPMPDALMKALLDGPESANLISPFPAGVKLLDIRFDTENATVHVNLSEQYGSLSGFDLTLADYCIVMTLCQIPGVETVRILMEGETIPYRGRQDMKKSDLLLCGIEEEPDSYLAVLYFPDRDNLGLRVEYRQMERSNSRPTELVMTELLRGPARNDARAVLPVGTQILGLTVSGTTCQIDLSSEFVDNAPQNEAGATMTLYALVNTLCTLGGISQVRVLVEGATLQNYQTVTVNSPISANYSFVID